MVTFWKLSREFQSQTSWSWVTRWLFLLTANYHHKCLIHPSISSTCFFLPESHVPRSPHPPTSLSQFSGGNPTYRWQTWELSLNCTIYTERVSLTRPKMGTRWCSHMENMSMSLTITISSWSSSKMASFNTSVVETTNEEHEWRKTSRTRNYFYCFNPFFTFITHLNTHYFIFVFVLCWYWFCCVFCWS